VNKLFLLQKVEI